MDSFKELLSKRMLDVLKCVSWCVILTSLHPFSAVAQEIPEIQFIKTVADLQQIVD